MFPTQSKVYRTSGLWLLPVVALALLLVGYAVFAASTAQAQTPAGDVCVEGLVIDWEEKPLAGWVVTLTSDISGFVPITAVSAPAPEEDDDDEYYNKKSKQYPYEYPDEDPDFEKGEFKFTEAAITAAVSPTVGAQTGTFTATIETRPGWEGVTPTTVVFDIEVGDKDCAQIRFKMRRIVVVYVYKIDVNHTPLGDWRISAVPGPGNLFASPQEEETSAAVTTTLPPSDTVVITGGVAVFTLTPGLWIFSEMAPKQDMDEAPNSYRPVVPPTGRQELLIDEDTPVDEFVYITFKNQLVTGCFIVRKLAVIPPDDIFIPPDAESDLFVYNVGGWGFQLLRKDGSVARQGVTDAAGEIRFDNLPLGPYTIVEEDRPGWGDVSDAELEYTVEGNICDDPTAVIEFFNEQDQSGYCIEGRKIDANGGYGIPGWEIAIKPLEEGDYDPANVFSDGEGEFSIEFPLNDYRVPGSQYEICEKEQDGWLPHTPTCQTVRLPEWPGACVQLEDFVNQQVGHSESEYPDHGKGGYPEGGKGSEYPEGSSNGQPSNGPEGYPEGSSNGQPSNGPEGYPEGPSNGQPSNGQPSNGQPSNGQGGYPDNGQQCREYHTVAAGEGLYDIGADYGVSPQAMLDANPSVKKGNEMWVYVGQQICIP